MKLCKERVFFFIFKSRLFNSYVIFNRFFVCLYRTMTKWEQTRVKSCTYAVGNFLLISFTSNKLHQRKKRKKTTTTKCWTKVSQFKYWFCVEPMFVTFVPDYILERVNGVNFLYTIVVENRFFKALENELK